MAAAEGMEVEVEEEGMEAVVMEVEEEEARS